MVGLSCCLHGWFSRRIERHRTARVLVSLARFSWQCTGCLALKFSPQRETTRGGYQEIGRYHGDGVFTVFCTFRIALFLAFWNEISSWSWHLKKDTAAKTLVLQEVISFQKARNKAIRKVQNTVLRRYPFFNAPSEKELILRFSVAKFKVSFIYICENTRGKLSILTSQKQPNATTAKCRRSLKEKEKNKFQFSKEKTETSYHPNNTVQTQSTYVTTSLLVFDCSVGVKLHAFPVCPNLRKRFSMDVTCCLDVEIALPRFLLFWLWGRWRTGSDLFYKTSIPETTIKGP